MTIKQARKILGPLAENVSDEQLAEDIRTAELLKDIFFAHGIKNEKVTSMSAY